MVMALNIALVGYGKMGREIEKAAISRGHQIVAKVGREGIAAHSMEGAQVAIEFTEPAAAMVNIRTLLGMGIPTVCGTTGWFDRILELEEAARDTPLVYASNFSLGVNILFQINQDLARMMAPYSDYQVSIEEVHHTAKKDAPSGTAISLAQGILPEYPELTGWALAETAGSQELPIRALRQDPVPGTHTVTYASEVDVLSLTHVAHSRAGFALGAVLAAEKAFHLKDGIHPFASLLFAR
ncbi:MAG: 4-hydroxy-tetrahydrodipicolinate reductase [Bacteroidota bacterium]|jgi:4-hydroxy-tetrahydrodipicolinate reductase